MIGWPGRNVVAVEGRLSALLSQSRSDHSLAPACELPQGAHVAGNSIERMVDRDPAGIEPTEVRRFDLTSELRFDEGADGLAFLRTLTGMCPPRCKLTVISGQDGQPETVYVRTAKRGVVHQRVYDKGVESGSHQPGERVRIEAQYRPQRGARSSPDQLAGSDLSAKFARSMAPYLGAERIVAAGPSGAVDVLLQQVAWGALGIAKAERMIGSVAVLAAHGRAIYGTDENGTLKSARRLRDLRKHGVALDQELEPDRVVPVGQLLREAVEEFSA